MFLFIGNSYEYFRTKTNFENVSSIKLAIFVHTVNHTAEQEGADWVGPERPSL
jgi:hypothetical protein